MSKGEFAKSELTITPAANGSYLVRRDVPTKINEYRGYAIADMICFSNYSDLLSFLCSDYNAAHNPEIHIEGGVEWMK